MNQTSVFRKRSRQMTLARFFPTIYSPPNFKKQFLFLILILGSCSLGLAQSYYWWPQGAGPDANWNVPANWSTKKTSYVPSTNLPGGTSYVEFNNNSSINCIINEEFVSVHTFVADDYQGTIDTDINERLDVTQTFSCLFAGNGKFLARATHWLRMWKGTKQTFSVSVGGFDPEPGSRVKISPDKSYCTIKIADPFWRLNLAPFGDGEFKLEGPITVDSRLQLNGGSNLVELHSNHSTGSPYKIIAKEHLQVNNTYVGTNPSNAIISMQGTGHQRIYGNGSATHAGEIAYLEIDKLSRGVKVYNNLTIGQEMNFLTGIVDTRTHNANLVVLAGATTPNASCRSFVDGNITKEGIADYVFPVGEETNTAAVYRPIAVEGIPLATPSASFTASYTDSDIGIANNSPIISTISTCRYWSLDENTGNYVPAKVGLTDDGVFCTGITGMPSLVRYDGTDWHNEGSVAPVPFTLGGCPQPTGRLTYTLYPTSDFGSFTFGNDQCPTTMIDSLALGEDTCILNTGCPQEQYLLNNVVFNSNQDYVNGKWNATQFWATEVQGVDEYEFLLTELDEFGAPTSTVVSLRQQSRRFSLFDLDCSEVRFDTKYWLQVRAWVNGNSCTYSVPLTIQTQSPSSTYLRDPYCDFYVAKDNQEILYAFPLRCASGYFVEVYEVGNPTNTTTIRVVNPQVRLSQLARTFQLGPAQRLRIRFRADYPYILGPWGKWCDVVTPLLNELTLTHPNCNIPGSTGTVELQVSGGFPPYTYTLTDGTNSWPATGPGTMSVDPGGVWEHILTEVNIPAGNGYELTVTDQVGNKVFKCFNFGIDSTQLMVDYDTDPSRSAYAQLTNFPGPRYQYEHKLKRNPSIWIFPDYLAEDDTELSVDFIEELANNWNYSAPIQLLTTTVLEADYTDPNTMAGAWVEYANNHPDIPAASALFWLKGKPAEIGIYGQNRAYIRETGLDDGFYLRKTLANGSLGFIPPVGGSGRQWNPSAVTSISGNSVIPQLNLDGNTQRQLIDNLYNYLGNKLYILNENGEAPPPLYRNSVLQLDQHAIDDFATSGTPSWFTYQSMRKRDFRQAFKDGFWDSGVADYFTWYQVDGQNYYHHVWEPAREIGTQFPSREEVVGSPKYYYSTPDFYVRKPETWNKFSSGADHGWKWISRGRWNEVKAGDKLFSPFVAAGWSSEQTDNVLPGQWLGLLKAINIAGAEFTYPGFFNEDPDDVAEPETYVWQTALPGYAQAITSRYEEILKDGEFLTATTDFINSSTEEEYHSFTDVDNSGALTLVRYLAATNEFIITTTLQPESNFGCQAQVSDEVEIDLSEAARFVGVPGSGSYQTLTNNLHLTINTSLQGNTYYLKVDDIVNPTDVTFYQLDSWHEASHPFYWSKDYRFEAEVFDEFRDHSTGYGLETTTTDLVSGAPVTIASPTDLTSTRTAVGFTGGSYSGDWNTHWDETTGKFDEQGPELDYHFLYRPADVGDQYSLWLSGRTNTSGQSTGAFVSIIETTSDGKDKVLFRELLDCIDDVEFDWYNTGLCCDATLPQLEVGKNYILRVMPLNDHLELDEVGLFAPTTNLGDLGITASANSSCTSSYQVETDFEWAGNCLDNQTRFYNRSSIIAPCMIWEWNMVAPIAIYGDVNPVHEFTTQNSSPGHSIALEIKSSSCALSNTFKIHQVVVSDAPVADAGLSQTYCFGDAPISIGAANDPQLTYQWTPAAGLNDATLSDPEFSYFEDVLYNLTVTDGIGCQGTDAVNMIVSRIDFDLVADCSRDRENATNYFVIQNLTGGRDALGGNLIPPQGCNSSTGYTIRWRYDDGTGFTDLSAFDDCRELALQLTGGNNAGQKVEVTISDAHCSVTKTFEFPVPDAVITAPVNVCGGQEVQLFSNLSTGLTECSTIKWSVQGFDEFYEPNPTFITDNHSGAPATLEVTLTITNGFGLEDQEIWVLFLHPDMSVVLTPSVAQVCDQAEFTVNALVGPGSIDNIVWSPSSALIQPGNNSATFVASREIFTNENGEMNISAIVTDNNGCKAEASTFVTIPDKLLVDAGNDILRCSSGPAYLEGNVLLGSGTYSYEWTIPPTSTTATNNPLLVSNEGIYELKVTDLVSGCEDITFIEVDDTSLTSPSATINLNPIGSSCASDILRSAEVDITAGTPEFTLFWDSDVHVGYTSGLPIGQYDIIGLGEGVDQSLRLVDDHGCVADYQFDVVTTPSNPYGDLMGTVTDPLCSGENTGMWVSPTYTANISSVETYPFLPANQIDFSTIPNQVTITGLSSGIKWARIILANGDCIQGTFEVNEGLFFNAWIYYDPSNACNGEISVAIDVPSSSVDLTWGPFSGTDVLNDVNAGTHDLVVSYEVTTGNYCSITIEDVEFEESGSGIQIIPFFTQPTMGNNDGALSYAVQGAVQEYTSVVPTFPSPATLNTNTLVASQVGAGNYELTITDANGCTSTHFLQMMNQKRAGSGGSPELGANDVGTPEISVFPNPFQSSTEIRFRLPEAGTASLKVYDLQGVEVADLFHSEVKASEWQSVVFAPENLSSGIYFYRLISEGQQLTGKVIYMDTE